MRPYRATDFCDPNSGDNQHTLLAEALIIPLHDWQRVCEAVPALPVWTSFPSVTNHDMLHLWLQHRPAFAIEGQYDTVLDHFRKNCVTSHPVNLDQALTVLADYESSLRQPPAIQHGTLASVAPDAESFNTFYFDSDSIPELPVFRVSDSQPLIAGQYVLNPTS